MTDSSERILWNVRTASPQAEDGSGGFWIDQESIPWTICFVVILIIMLIFPFCRNKEQRALCRRRIKERRWIYEDRSNSWYHVQYRQRQEERRQQLEAEQREFEISRTQEDEIREQFLLSLMVNNTVTLSKNDIVDANNDVMEPNLKNEATDNSATTPATTDVGSSSFSSIEGDTDTFDLESSQDIETPSPSNLLADDDDGQAVMAFQDVHGFVILPSADKESSDDAKCRSVPNGCSICLCPFQENEKITWSSRKDCSHAFHQDCLLHWFLSVGRKQQEKRYRENPTMTGDEALDNICNFSRDCPCCRQSYYPESEEQKESKSNETEQIDV